MEHLLGIAAFIFYLWRMVLCATIGAVLALILSALFPALPTGVSFALVFVTASLGIIWHVGVLSARETSAGRQEVQISRPVSFLGIALLGGLWGGLAEAAVGTAAALAATVVAPWLLGTLFAAIARRPIGVGAMALAMVAALTGFAAPHAITLAFRAAGA